MKQVEFPELLQKAQNYMSTNYSSLLSDTNHNKNKELLKSYLKQFLISKDIGVNGFTSDELVTRLYEEMAEYSFLTPFLSGSNTDWEEININRWDDTKISYCDDRGVQRSPQQFLSPTHANDVIRRLLRESNIIFDKAKPCVRGHLNNKIRITVIGQGVIDDDAGIACSIRYINPKKLGKQDFVKSGTATEEMLNFLSTLYRYGISMCLAGATGTGKTTIMSWILSTLPIFKRIYTVENTTREFDLTIRDEKGNVINNVIHTVTRDSENPSERVTEQLLLEQGLTLNPDYICMAEMKGSEAFETQEAARTGHAVISTVHAERCVGIYDRLLDLCSIKGNLSGELLRISIAKAFPITFFVRKSEDNVRRIAEICECQIDNNGCPKLNKLYQYHTFKNEIIDGKTVITGKFERIGIISPALQQQLRDNGIPENVLQKFIGGDKI